MKYAVGSILSVLGCFALAQEASATSITHVLRCRDSRPIVDAGYNVRIDALQGPPVEGQPSRLSLQAILSVNSFVGPRESQTYIVTREQGSALGAPVIFKGKDFNLEVKVDGTPIEGGIFSHLTAEYYGYRVSQDMICNFTR